MPTDKTAATETVTGDQGDRGDDLNGANAAETLQPLLVVEDEPTLSHPFDTLNLVTQARVIAGAALGTRGPFTIGVHAKWGQGKTSVLRQARSLLDYAPVDGRGRKTKRRWPTVVTVWFNAWQYQHEEQPIVPLVSTIVREVDRHLDETKSAPQKAKEAFGAIARTLRSVAYGFSAKANVKVPGFVDLEAGMVAKDMIDREEKLSRRGDPLLEQSVYYGAFEQLDQLGGQPEKDRYGNLKPIDPKTHPKIVVFIDDLDRCTPDKAVRLLEHLKLVLCQPGFVFVLGVAREVLVGLIKHRYEKEYHLENIVNAGRDYLDKIIQLPIDLPDHTKHFKSHAGKLLAQPGARKSLPLTGAERSRLADLLELTTERNPRKLVRQLNTLIVDAHVARLTGLVEWPAVTPADGETE